MDEPEPCDCEDAEPEDPDDSLCDVCVCGHLIHGEHKGGFFKRCIFNTKGGD